MKKLIFIVMLGLSSISFSGPVVEIYECQINKGKTLEDLSNMMDTFSTYLKKAGLSDSYKAHAGFQQVPIKPGSINWIGISPSAEKTSVKLLNGLLHLKMDKLLESYINCLYLPRVIYDLYYCFIKINLM